MFKWMAVELILTHAYLLYIKIKLKKYGLNDISQNRKKDKHFLWNNIHK